MISIVKTKTNRGHTEDNPVLKARNVYNGSVKRGLYTKEETASPTVGQNSFLVTALIDAVEERDKAITDVKGAYLNAIMKDFVLMKITGKSVDLFCELDPTLEEFVILERKRKVIYVQLDKALYGCVKSALLWYEMYLGTLKEIGFKVNPYDLCVANKEIDGSQCTVCWYVDDNKISHKDPKVVDMIIERIEEKYGKMSQTRGDNLEFFGMDIKFREKKIEIGMKKHVKKAIDLFEEEITKTAATPARHYLFEVREEAEPLPEKKAENFHSVVALLLFVSRRCRLDVQTAVGFLTTRVSKPDEDDWIKLQRLYNW